MTTYEISGQTIEISEAPRFSRRRPPRYIFTIVGAADYAQDLDRTFASEADALAAARQYIGVDVETGTCACGRPATMTASVGRTCDACYDKHADAI